MATNPCSIKIDCDCAGYDFPISNYSAEAPEQSQKFYALAFPPATFTSAGCLSVCTSSISQLDADLCALAQESQCRQTNDEAGGGGGGGGGDPLGGTTTYSNNPISCTVLCPDGSSTTVTIPTGVFWGFLSQAAADAIAYAEACTLAKRDLICLSDLTSRLCAGSSSSLQIYLTGQILSSTGETWSLYSGSLPTGMTLLSSPAFHTCYINGTPTTAGIYTFSIKVVNGGRTKVKSYIITVSAISPSSLPDATIGVPYSQLLSHSPVEAVTWGVLWGQSLPPGLTINENTGLISGTPTTLGTFSFDLYAQTVADPHSCVKRFTLNVAEAQLPSEACCDEEYLGTITATGLDFGVDDNYWELESGSLPPGLSLQYLDANGPNTNQVTGTPTTAGEYTFTVKVTAPDTTSTTMEFTICVICITSDPVGADADTLPDGYEDEAYSVTLEATSCASAPLSWQVTDGVLPAGLTLDESTGIISGTPTEMGTFTFTVTLQTEAS